MLQRIFTWTILAAIWKRYGRVLKVLPLLLAGIFIISFIHTDYVRYVEVSENQALLHWSFVIKWGLILAVVAWYWYFVRTSLSTKKHKLNDSVMAKSDAKNNRQASDEQKSDPFSEIRTKTKLRTRAEIMLEKKGEDSD